MSLQMRVVHFKGSCACCSTATATEQMALHAPKPHPMPDACVRVSPRRKKWRYPRVSKRGLRSGGALIYLHGGAYKIRWSWGQWHCRGPYRPRNRGLPVIIPDSPACPANTAAEAFDFVQPIVDGSAASSSSATRRSAWRCPRHAATRRTNVRWTARPVRAVGGCARDEPRGSRR